MYCSKCGKEINDNAVICVHCGVPVEGKFNNPAQLQSSAEPTIKSVLSLVGFILAMISVALGIFLPLPAVALALSIAGFCYSRSKKQPDSFGLAGIIVGAIMLVMWTAIFIATLCS